VTVSAAAQRWAGAVRVMVLVCSGECAPRWVTQGWRMRVVRKGASGSRRCAGRKSCWKVGSLVAEWQFFVAGAALRPLRRFRHGAAHGWRGRDRCLGVAV